MRSFFLAVGVGAMFAVAYAGCGLTVEGELADTSGSPPTSSSSTGGYVDAGKECSTREECNDDTECRTFSCVEGQCLVEYKPDGTPVQAGSVAGDCHKSVCKDGQPTTIVDDTDVVMDNDPCIVESCATGIPGKSPAPDGTPCGNNLACSSGLCEGCNQNPANCPQATDCKEYTCPNNSCVETILKGKITSNPEPDDCLAEMCDETGNKAIAPNPVEVPAQDMNICDKETCEATGMVGHQSANDGMECAMADGDCYNPRTCAVGVCKQNPKMQGVPPSGPDMNKGDCQAIVCDGNGGTMMVDDDTDVPTVDNNPDDCSKPGCMMGDVTMVPATSGAMCSVMGGSKCCGMTCCPDTGAGYCDKNQACCMSGKTCNGDCCQTGHDCEEGTNGCCPSNKRCPGNVCCPGMQTCKMGMCAN